MSNDLGFKEIKAFSRGLKKELTTQVKRIALELAEGVQELNPVRTGYSVSEWIFSKDDTDKPIEAMDRAKWSRIAAEGQQVFFPRSMEEEIHKVKLPVFYLLNNAFYIESLETRSSMVALNVATARAKIEELVGQTDGDLSS